MLNNISSFLNGKLNYNEETNNNKTTNENISSEVNEFVKYLNSDEFKFGLNQDEISFSNLTPELNNTEAKPQSKIQLNSYEEIKNAIQDLKLDNKVNISQDQLWNKDTKVSSYIKDDLSKLLYVKENGLTEQEIFVPGFTTNEEASKYSKVGDICTIGDSNKISIKLNDGTMKELNLSPSKYLELFPPAERYASQQGSIGDCYLVMTLDAMLKSPQGKEKLLSCFTENEDGSVTVKYPTSDIEFTLNPGEKTEDYISREYFSESNTRRLSFGLIDEYTTKTSIAENYENPFQLKGPQGLKMLEHLYGMVEYDKELTILTKNLETTDNESEKEILQELVNKYKNDKDTYITTFIGNGGLEDIVYQTFNITPYPGINDEELLTMEEKWDNLIITASTQEDKPELGIFGHHAYKLEPMKNEDGSYSYLVINPWNTSLNKTLTLEEVKNTFSKITAANINDNLPTPDLSIKNNTSKTANDILNDNDKGLTYTTNTLYDQYNLLQEEGFNVSGYELNNNNTEDPYLTKLKSDGSREYVKLLTETDSEGNSSYKLIRTIIKPNETESTINIYNCKYISPKA